MKPASFSGSHNHEELKEGRRVPKLYFPSTLNIDLILWHTQLIVCAMAFPVVEFSRQGYTIRKVFG